MSEKVKISAVELVTKVFPFGKVSYFLKKKSIYSLLTIGECRAKSFFYVTNANIIYQSNSNLVLDYPILSIIQ